MRKSNLAILILMMIAIGVFLISNYVTNWTNDVLYLKDKVKEEILTSHREEMRQVLVSAQEGLMYDIENNKLNVSNEETINDLIYKHISPLSNSSFGEILLLRINPDQMILYDSSEQTMKDDVDLRKLDDEIISQNQAELIIESKIGQNNYFNDGVLTSEELEEIKERYPEVYKELDKFISHNNLNNLEKILLQIENGNPTSTLDNHTWELKNGKIELLEWVIIPPGSLGFDNEPSNYFGIRNKNHKWVLILRSDKGKVLNFYEDIEEEYLQKVAIAKLLYISFIFILISSILIIVYYTSIIEIK